MMRRLFAVEIFAAATVGACAALAFVAGLVFVVAVTEPPRDPPETAWQALQR